MMKKIFKERRKLVAAFLLLLFFQLTGAAQPAQWNKKKAAAWYSSYEGLKGLPLKPGHSVNKRKLAAAYHNNPSGWDEAFRFIKEVNPDTLKAGTYPIDGENMFVRVTDADTKVLDSTRWELHKRYHDIHYDVYGKEKVGIRSLSDATQVTAYDSARDITFYKATGKYFLGEPGEYFIIFNNELHRHMIKVEGYNRVKKVVIKIRDNNP